MSADYARSLPLPFFGCLLELRFDFADYVQQLDTVRCLVAVCQGWRHAILCLLPSCALDYKRCYEDRAAFWHTVARDYASVCSDARIARVSYELISAKQHFAKEPGKECASDCWCKRLDADLTHQYATMLEGYKRQQYRSGLHRIRWNNWFHGAYLCMKVECPTESSSDWSD